MSGTINNRNTVMIREEKHFFRSPQFSLDFPKKLDGIIDPDEFQQSINNINHACQPTLYEKILICSLFLCSSIGLLTFISGISVIWLGLSTLWIPLMSIGFAMFMIFFTIAIFVSSQIYRSCDTRLDKAVDMESRKYSIKQPVPTKWRLDMTIYSRRYSTAAPTNIQYFLLIDIDQRTGSEIESNVLNSNLNTSKPTSHISQESPTVSLSRPSLPTTNSTDTALQIEKQDHIGSSA